MQSRLVFRRNRVIFDHCSKRYHWSVKVHSKPPFIWCLPTRQEILNVSQIAVTFHRNPPTILFPDLIATIPQMSPLSLFALLSQQSHLFLICVALTYNDSRIFLTRLAKFQGIVSVNDFWFLCRLQELH